MPSSNLVLSTIAVELLLASAVGASSIDFENIASGTLVRDQFQSIGVRVTGAGGWSGLVYSEGEHGVQNFGNSPTQIMDVGNRGQPTTIRFVNPAHPEQVIGATSISFIVGDGDPDSETFEITFFDASGDVLNGPNRYTTLIDGLWISATSSNLGVPIGYIEIVIVPESESGVVLDDLGFELTSLSAREDSSIQQSPFRFSGNWPNPFNPTTAIRFDLSEPAYVSLRIYDASGQLVRILLNGKLGASGRHETLWRGRDESNRAVAPGIYFYQLTTGDYAQTGRMCLLH